MIIESVKNEQIKNIIKLRDSAKDRKRQGLYIIEGPKMVLEAAHHNCVSRIYISESVYNDLTNGTENNNNRYGGLTSAEVMDVISNYTYDIVSDHVFSVMTDTVNPQGMLALVPVNDMTPDSIINKNTQKDNLRLLILEDVQDPGNLGTIFRTAEAAHFDGIIMTKGCVSAYNPKVVRSTMGAILRLPFSYVDNTKEALELCKKEGVRVYATALSGKDIREVSYDNKSVFIIGNESRGISSDTLLESDELIKIPMNPVSESLNAAVAAGIIMYDSVLTFI